MSSLCFSRACLSLPSFLSISSHTRFIRTRSQTAARRKAKDRFLDPIKKDKRSKRNKREEILDIIAQSLKTDKERLDLFREYFSKHSPILFGRVQAMLGASILVADTTPEKLSLPRRKRLPFRKNCFHKGKEMKLVCGDEVVWWAGPTLESPGKVMKILPRKNVFARTRVDWKGNAQEVILASNIAQMAIIIAPRPRFNTKLLDRYLAAARDCHIPAVIIFTKMDLMPSSLPRPEAGLQNDDVDQMMQKQIESFVRTKLEEERAKEQEEDDERRGRHVRDEEEQQPEQGESTQDEISARRMERVRERQTRRLEKQSEKNASDQQDQNQQNDQDEATQQDDQGEENDENEEYFEDDEGRFDHYDITESEWLKMEELLSEYHKLNYAIFRISSKTGEGTDDLRKFFDCRSPTLLVGQTGSGKSALLNVLCPDLALSTRTLSGKMQGRHTTTTILEHILPSGCRVMDSPGFSNYGPRRMRPTDVANSFVEFQGPMQLCRYPKRCLHINEQDCGVRKAVDLGLVSKSRYESYVELVEIMEGFWKKYRKDLHPHNNNRRKLSALKFV